MQLKLVEVVISDVLVDSIVVPIKVVVSVKMTLLVDVVIKGSVERNSSKLVVFISLEVNSSDPVVDANSEVTVEVFNSFIVVSSFPQRPHNFGHREIIPGVLHCVFKNKSDLHNMGSLSQTNISQSKVQKYF